MFKKLEELEKRFKELEQQLSLAEVIQDVQKFRSFTKEHSKLTPILKTYNEYRNLDLQIKGNEDILKNESDSELKDLAKEELDGLRVHLEQLKKELNILLLPKDPNDDKNVIVEIRAGTGGDESTLFAAELFRMYTKYGDRKGWKFEIVSSNPTGLGGFKEIIVSIEGNMVYSFMKHEAGTHRVQRVPVTETQGRVHTSAVTVAVLPEAEEVELNIPPDDIKTDVMRSGGAGGQHVNKTESAVRMTHLPTGIVVVCQEEKSQIKNRAKAIKVLKARVLAKIEEEKNAERTQARRSMVGSGDRSEKIRTYNFPQNRLSDHRIGLTLYKLDKIMDGDLEDIMNALIAHYQAEALKSSTEL